jgi:RNA polymerase sigma-70 factor (ECF subfamily)
MVPSNFAPLDDLDSTYMRHLVDRVRRGDGAASNELLHRAGARLEELARIMLRQFPAVGRYEETGDVLQGASMRLLRALGEVRPVNTRAFFGLAAEQIRRELIDLARHHFGRQGWAANHESNAPSPDSSAAVLGLCREPLDADELPEELEEWAAFHVAVVGLPVDEREVFNLRYYHGWKEKDIAELLQMENRTVRRKWRHACLHLNALLRQ